MSFSLPIDASTRGPETFTAVEGQAAFTGSYPLQASGDVVVETSADGGATWTARALDADYTVSGLNSPAGFTISFETGLPAGTKVRHYGLLPLTNKSDFSPANTLKSGGLNARFDREIMSLQEMRRDLNRAVRTPIDQAGQLLPPGEGNAVIGWSADGSTLENLHIAAPGDLIKANQTDAQAGSDDVRYMTPLSTFKEISAFRRTINPRDFPWLAKGDDVADDYVALSTCYAYCLSINASMGLTSGTYKCSQKLALAHDRGSFLAMDANVTLHFTGAGRFIEYKGSDYAGDHGANRITFGGAYPIKLVGNANATDAIWISLCHGSRFNIGSVRDFNNCCVNVAASVLGSGDSLSCVRSYISLAVSSDLDNANFTTRPKFGLIADHAAVCTFDLGVEFCGDGNDWPVKFLSAIRCTINAGGTVESCNGGIYFDEGCTDNVAIAMHLEGNTPGQDMYVAGHHNTFIALHSSGSGVPGPSASSIAGNYNRFYGGRIVDCHVLTGATANEFHGVDGMTLVVTGLIDDGTGTVIDNCQGLANKNILGTTGTGLLAQTGVAYSFRSISGPAAGITVTNGNGSAGNPTLALANDMAALEALSGTGFAQRTGTDTWSLTTTVSLTTLVSGVLPVANGGTNSGSASGTALDNITGFSSTGHLVRTAAGTYAFRSLAAPAAGITISNGDGVAGTPTFALANDLAALEALSTTGFAIRSGTDTWTLATLVNLATQVSGITPVANGGTNAGSASGTALDNITGFAATGHLVRTAAGTYAFRSLAAPAAGITVSNGDGVAGTPTFALANDLAALEALSTTGFAIRSGTDTWTLATLVNLATQVSGITPVANGGTNAGSASGTALDNITGFAATGVLARTAAGTYAFRAITAPAAGITVSNGDGVSGAPTLALANDLAAIEALSTTGFARRTGTDTWSLASQVAIGSDVSGLGAGIATFLQAPSSANFAAALTDEDGSGVVPLELTGSWTPADASGAGLTFTGVNCKYTRLGNIMLAYGTLTFPNTANGNTILISGLPVAAANGTHAVIPGPMTNNIGVNAGLFLRAVAGTSTFNIYQIGTATNATNSLLSTGTISFIVIYPIV